MQRTYEIMFIVRPDILDEDLDKLIAGLEANITQGGGSIKSLEKLGRRKLAYYGQEVQRRQTMYC